MFDITENDVKAVYGLLKNKYELILTNTFALDEGFTADCAILVGKAHGQIIHLHEYGGEFVLDVMDEARSQGTHWHPLDIESAVMDITEFMEGKQDYSLDSFLTK